MEASLLEMRGLFYSGHPTQEPCPIRDGLVQWFRRFPGYAAEDRRLGRKANIGARNPSEINFENRYGNKPGLRKVPITLAHCAWTGSCPDGVYDLQLKE